MSISRENQVKITNAIWQYLVDHADELYLIECSDLTSNDIWIHLRRCGVEDALVSDEEKTEETKMIWCYCEECKHHDDDDTCKLDRITVSDREMTAAGFLPQCQEYEEEE